MPEQSEAGREGLESALQNWLSAWVNPDNGPSWGGRRDAQAIGVTDSPVLQAERTAYESVVTHITDMLIAARQTGAEQAALHEIKMVLGDKLRGHGLSNTRTELLEHVLLEVLHHVPPKQPPAVPQQVAVVSTAVTARAARTVLSDESAQVWPAAEAEKQRIAGRCHSSDAITVCGELMQQAETMPIASRFSRTKGPYSIMGGPPGGFISRGDTEAGHKRRQLLTDLRKVMNDLLTAFRNLGEVATDMLATRTESDGSSATNADVGKILE